jgi:hypothetical protein
MPSTCAAVLQLGALNPGMALEQRHGSGSVQTFAAATAAAAAAATHPLPPLHRPPSAPALQHSRSADASFSARQRSAPLQPPAAPRSIRHSHSADAAVDVTPAERLPKHSSRFQQLMPGGVGSHSATQLPASAFASPDAKPPPLPTQQQQPPSPAAKHSQPHGITPAPTDETKLSLPSLSPADFAAIFAAVSGGAEQLAGASPVTALSSLLPSSRLTAHSLESADTAFTSRVRDLAADSRLVIT